MLRVLFCFNVNNGKGCSSDFPGTARYIIPMSFREGRCSRFFPGDGRLPPPG